MLYPVVEVTRSLSNLLKQYYVVHQEGSTRIINSNGLVEERIRNLAVGAQVPETERLDFPEEMDGETDRSFVSGISAERIEEVPAPDPKEMAKQILAEAREQADQMLNDAHQQAGQILAEAKEQAEVIYAEQKEQGYAEGVKAREEELAEAERRLQEAERSLRAEVDGRKEELESEFQMRLDEMETDVVDALIPVFDKVFHIQFSDKREMLLALIRNVLMNIEIGNKIRIRVNEADKAMLAEHMDDIREQVSADVSIELIQDRKLEDGQCQLETNYGVFDCGIDTHFTNLVKDIRSLV